MSRSVHPKRRLTPVVAGALLFLTLGCSTDSPTAPDQADNGPGAGGPTPATRWNISVSADASEVTVDSTAPITITVRIRRADNGANPANGTTTVISSSLGSFGSSAGSSSAVLSLLNGRATVLFFPGSILGSALISAQLEDSVGQLRLPIVEAITPVLASFTFANSNNNLSVQFRNTSTGDPTDFLWDFGDGATSAEEHPVHLFPNEGDFVVELTASKVGSSDSESQIVSVSVDPIVASFSFLVDDLTVVFQDTSTGDPSSFSWDFGDGRKSSEQNPTHEYRREGSYVVQLTASNSNTSDTTSQTVTVNENLFIRLISPVSGPPGGGQTVTIDGQGFREELRVFFGSGLGTVISVTDSQIKVRTPAVTLPTEECDSDDDGIDDGIRTLDLVVAVTVELSTGASETITGGYTYVSPTGSTCVP